MRRNDIVSGILLILSTIDFALAAPVLVQERRQAGVDVVHIHKDVISVLGKRGFEDIAKMVEEFFNTGVKPIESSEAHASSSSALPGPDHGSTNVVQAPGPPASSSANPGVLMEPSSPSSVQGAWGDVPSEDQWWYKDNDEFHNAPLYTTPAPSEHGSDHELTGAHAPPPDQNTADSYFDPNYWFPPLSRPASPKGFGQAPEYHPEHVQQPNPGPSTDSDFNWDYWTKLEDPPPAARPASSKENMASENQEHVQQPNPGPSTDSDFDWNYWTKLEDPPPAARPASPKDFDWDYWQKLDDSLAPRPTSPKEFGQARDNQEHVQQPNTGPSADADFDWDYWQNLEDPPSSNPKLPTKLDSDRNLMPAHQPPPYPLSPAEFGTGRDHDVNPPSPGAESPTDPEHEVVAPPPPPPNLGSLIEPEAEVVPGPPPSPDPGLHLDHQSSSAAFQPEDLQAAIYAAKGKTKASRRVSGTARDVGRYGPEGVVAY